MAKLMHALQAGLKAGIEPWADGTRIAWYPPEQQMVLPRSLPGSARGRQPAECGADIAKNVAATQWWAAGPAQPNRDGSIDGRQTCRGRPCRGM